MKKLILSFLSIIFLIGCNDAENEISDENKGLTGNWVKFEIYHGSPNYAPHFTNGEVVEFKNDGSFITTNTNDVVFPTAMTICNGSYTQEDDKLIIHLPCRADSKDELEQKIEYSLNFTPNEFTITPVNSNCDEGCWFKFKRL